MSYQPVPALGKDWLTPFFDLLLEIVGLGRALTAMVLERADIQDGERVLDVGCGTATLLIAAKTRTPGAQLVGVDTDEQVLQIARKKIARHQVEVEVVQAGAEQLPFPPASFDVVTSSLVFHHLPTEIKQWAMRETYRVLSPGGRFLLADLGKPEGVLLITFFALGRLVQADEARYIQDNKAGKLPLFLEEAGVAVQELFPRYRGVQFLLATKDAGVQERGKTMHSNALLPLAPTQANVIGSNEQVQVGDLLLLHPDEKVPVDGIVIEGESAIDESMVTGASLPVSKQPGDEVIGGTVNGSGSLRITATKVGSETALAQIVQLVQKRGLHVGVSNHVINGGLLKNKEGVR